MTIAISGTSGITQTGSFDSSSTFGFKNRIINSAMVIDQRNAGASTTPTGSTYTLDRFRVLATQSSKFSVQQNAGAVTPPTGFTNYLGITSLSAYSVTTGDNFSIQQKIEGYNVADFSYGTASASTTTLSFWVRSSLTGTFGGVFGNEAANRCYVFSYTINAANTWEQKTITVIGDTAGTWVTNNGNGLDIRFNFGSGSDKLAAAGSWGSTFYNSVTGQTSVVGTLNATFYITGVQLEKGSTATSFDYRPYGTELVLCQRYYCKEQANAIGNLLATGFCDATTTTTNYFLFPVTMRTNPTALEQSGTAGDYSVFNAAGSSIVCSAVPTFSSATTKAARFVATVASGLTGGNATMVRAASTNAYLGFSAEL